MNIKNIVIFAAGAAIGSLVTYKLTEEYFEKLIQEELDSIRERVGKELKTRDDDAEMVEFNEPEEEKVIDFPKRKYEEISTQYNTMHKKELTPTEMVSHMKNQPEEEKEDAEYVSISEEANKRTDIDEPHIISIEEYNDECAHYDKLTLYYYNDDEVVTEENEEILTDPENFIGDEALLSFGMMSEDPDCVFVRNDRLSIDYEIIRVYKSYQETVLGIEPTEPNQKIRRRAAHEE